MGINGVWGNLGVASSALVTGVIGQYLGWRWAFMIPGSIAILIGLFESPATALWLIVLFVGLQQLEGHIVAPQVFRLSLRINPILVILALLIGYQLYGVAGALIALPIATVIRQTVLYLRKHLELESWGTPPPSQPA